VSAGEKRLSILITGACGVAPRAIARSLGMSERVRDARLVGADRGGNWYGFYEGLYHRVYRVLEPRDAGYADLISEICRRESIDVALVGPEAEVLYWSEHEFPAPALLPSPRFVKVAISKRNLYDALQDTGLIPRYSIVGRDDLLERRGLELDGDPIWLRDYAEATSSGSGSIKVADVEQAYAWAYLNPAIANYMAAEHLPGRNVACCLLFCDDELLKTGCYERLEYFMGRLAVSGITGNISRGCVIDDPEAREVSERAIRTIADGHDEPAHGLFTVDLRAAADGSLKVTEINVRHVANTSAVAAGGANLAEAQVLATLGRLDEIGDLVVPVGEGNAILRDIDGPPLWIADYHEPPIGDYVEGRPS
jgi:carbamoyl-phosphate synthase large subunit